MNNRKWEGSSSRGASPGQGLTEYAMILFLAGIAVVAILLLTSPAVGNIFSDFAEDAPIAPPALVGVTPIPTDTPDPLWTPTNTATATVDPRATETQPAPGVPTQTNTPTSTATATNTATATATQPPPFVTCEYREVGGIVIVEAEHFAGSAGGSGHAWHTEIVPANYAGSSAMRALPADGVNMGDSGNGPRLDYKLRFETAGNYYIYVRGAATGGSDDSLHAGLGSPHTTGSQGLTGFSAVANQYNWQRWPYPLSVTAGTHTFSIWMREAGVRFDRFILSTNSNLVGSSSTGLGPVESVAPAGCAGAAPPTPTPIPCTVTRTTLPARIEAEDFACGGEGTGFHESANDGGPGGGTRRPDAGSNGPDLESTGDSGGGYNVGWANTGEWLRYTINVPTTRAYNIVVRAASPDGTGRFHLELDGSTIGSARTVPNTGGWQNYTDVTLNSVTLTAGNHNLDLRIDSSGANYNYIEFTPAPTILFEDNFNRSNSNSVGNGWSENEPSSNSVRIQNSRLEFYRPGDASNRPYVYHTFTSVSSGQVTWEYTLLWERTGSDTNYRVNMVLGNRSGSTVQPGVHLVWARIGGRNERLGYVTGSGDTSIMTLDYQATIRVVADVTARRYNVYVDGNLRASNIPFENNVSLNAVAFYTDRVNDSGFNGRWFDNVLIRQD